MLSAYLLRPFGRYNQLLQMKNIAFFVLFLTGAMTVSAQESFEQTVDRYFNDRFSFSPSEGTVAGFHEYDSKLEDASAQAVAAQAEMDRRLFPSHSTSLRLG